MPTTDSPEGLHREAIFIETAPTDFIETAPTDRVEWAYCSTRGRQALRRCRRTGTMYCSARSSRWLNPSTGVTETASGPSSMPPAISDSRRPWARVMP